MAPTLSSRATVRLEPSAYVEKAEIDRVCDALGRLAELLRAGDAYHLLRYVVGRDAKIRLVLQSLLPRRWMDGIIHRVFRTAAQAA